MLYNDSEYKRKVCAKTLYNAILDIQKFRTELSKQKVANGSKRGSIDNRLRQNCDLALSWLNSNSTSEGSFKWFAI